MRLKSIYISQYKNLKDFTLSFDSNSFIDVFVGKNCENVIGCHFFAELTPPIISLLKKAKVND